MSFTIIKVASGVGGSHEIQTYPTPIAIMDGWAYLSPGLGTPDTLENLPFGNVIVESIDGIPTVTSWMSLPMPEPEEPPEPPASPEERLEAETAAISAAIERGLSL